MNKVNLAEKFYRLSDYWAPKIAGELNDAYVKLAKLKGEFIWHQHEREDELFLVIKGVLRMQVLADGASEIVVREGEFLIVPHGTQHMPVADDEVQVLLLEPKTTLNTGNVRNERTVEPVDKV